MVTVTNNWIRAFSVALIASVFAYFISTTLQSQRYARYSEDISQQVYHRGFSEYFQWLNAMQSGGESAASKTPFAAYISTPPQKDDWNIDLAMQGLESSIVPQLPRVSEAGIILSLKNDNWDEDIVVRWDISAWVDGLASDIGYGPLLVNVSYDGYTLTRDASGLINPKVFEHFIFKNMTLIVDDQRSMKPFSELLLALLNGMAVGLLAGVLVYVYLNRRDYNEVVLQKLRDQLVASDRMAGLGEFSAGLVHEIKSPVAVIHSNLQMLRSQVSAMQVANAKREEHNAKEDAALDMMQGSIGDSLVGTNLLANIVQDMGQLVGGEQDKRWSNFNLKVNSVLNLTRILRPKNIHIENKLVDLPPIYCNPSNIIQVVLNLIVNATQALEAQGGTITLEERFDETYLYLVISDDGPGMSKEVAKQVFSPFFTTRPQAGTGLGLALSKRLVEEHDGTLTLETAPGKGAKFTIKIPIGKQ